MVTHRLTNYYLFCVQVKCNIASQFSMEQPEDMFTSAALRFGVEQLCEHQLDVCQTYYQKKDVFFIAPTGESVSL